MLLYMTVFAVAIFFAFCADFIQRQIEIGRSGPHALTQSARTSFAFMRMNRNALIIFSAIPLVLLSGLRYDTGYDYLYSYVPSLEETRIGRTPHYDPVFNMIISFFAKFESNQWFFFFMSLYTVAMMYYAIRKQTQYVLIPIALYCTTFTYLRSFCFVAQYVSIATLFVGMAFMLHKKYIPAFILAILGGLLHQTGFIMLPFFLLYFIAPRAMIVLAVLVPVVSLAGRDLIRTLVEHISAGTRFDYYISSRYDTGYSDTRLMLINLAIYIVFIAAYLLSQRRMVNDKIANWYILAQSFALSIMFLQSVIPVGYRFAWFFMVVQLVSIPYILHYVFKGSLFYIVNFAIILCFAIWMFAIPVHGTSEVLPYHPIFDPSASY